MTTDERPGCLSAEWERLRWSFGEGRHGWHSRRAWLRATIDRHLLRYNREHCQRCGRRVGLSWWSMVGWTNVVVDGGRIRCIRCFNREAWAANAPVGWLAVTLDEFDTQVRQYYRGAAYQTEVHEHECDPSDADCQAYLHYSDAKNLMPAGPWRRVRRPSA